MEESELRNTAPEYDPKPCPLCGRTMRRGLIQSGGVLYFTDEEKYWINCWRLCWKNRKRIRKNSFWKKLPN